jgi:hypothetical protein
MSSWILEGQLHWARRARIEFDEAGWVADARDQLLCPLSPETRSELEAVHRDALGRDGKPGALGALDSTHVLLCHLIEPLRALGAQWLDRTLGGRGTGSALRLCEALQDPGAAPDGGALESELVVDGAHPIYVLARYREPYSEPDRRRPPDPDGEPERWAGLPGCRGLALDLRANPRRFERLEVGRILEAIRRLAARHGRRGFRLVHLWFDGPGAEARAYAREIDRFRLRVGGDVEWAALSWRSLFEGLRSAGLYDAGYARSVEDRYFHG